MVSSLESAPERLWTELFDLDKPEVPLLAPIMMLNTAGREEIAGICNSYHLEIPFDYVWCEEKRIKHFLQIKD